MKHIGIIGAGVSGLTTAKAFLEAGYAVTVLEKSGSLGGVWEKSRSYVGVATQTTRDEYAFSDFPMPKDYPLWPSGEQVQRYLYDYADHFGILPYIRFNTEVSDMHFDGLNWKVTIQQANASRTLVFAFVAVCTGTFHQPYIPKVEGMESFLQAGGQVLHSSQVKSDELLRNKKVAIVGFAKSATDIATRAAALSRGCTLLYRKAQWKVPRYFGNRVNMRYLLFSRFSEAFFSARKKTFFESLLHTIGRPLVWLQWRGLEALLKKQFRLKECGMVPAHRIEDQISCSLGVEPSGFYELVRSKKIRAFQTEIRAFKGQNVLLKDGSQISPDLVIFGTGFRQHLPFLHKYEPLLKDDQGLFSLYRNILHPDLPQMGFVGFNSSFFSPLTSEVAANWLVACMAGDLKLPAKEEMKAIMQQEADWRKKVRPIAAEFSGLCVAPFNFQHLDQLMKDMGLRTRATRMLLYELFKPINPADYAKLLRARKWKVLEDNFHSRGKKEIVPDAKRIIEAEQVL
ncbi:MAG TPA: NAD(P)-binding domain-containing protein [Flavisolibacter sp.]|nr:NAD(P)-binding domain-containing protein [Flavisolibacter sp.]